MSSISLCCLTALARTSRTMLTTSGESAHSKDNGAGEDSGGGGDSTERQ